MDKVVRKYSSLAEMKTDEYRDWQQRPVHERMRAVMELSLAAYNLTGQITDIRLEKTLVHLPFPER